MIHPLRLSGTWRSSIIQILVVTALASQPHMVLTPIVLWVIRASLRRVLSLEFLTLISQKIRLAFRGKLTTVNFIMILE